MGFESRQYFPPLFVSSGRPRKKNVTIKACFSNKKYLIAIQTRPTQIVNKIFLIEKFGFKGLLKIIGVQNQLHVTFCTALVLDING
jgi:hypothetical protein